MEIIVLGTGCAKCKTTYETVKKVIEENNLDTSVPLKLGQIKN